MENEKMIAVLTEILDEQKEIAKMMLVISGRVNDIETGLEVLKEGNNPSKSVADSGPIDALQRQLNTEANEIKNKVDILSKNTRQEKRLLLFPEHNAREYYSVVLRWVLYIIIATYSYWIVKYMVSLFYSLHMQKQ
jgi:hypothetical protein